MKAQLTGKYRLNALICFVIVAVSTFFLPLKSYPQDIEAQKREIQYLQRLPAAIQEAKSRVKEANFGPFFIQTHCGYDDHWYCFGPCSFFSAEHALYNFLSIKASMTNHLDNVNASLANFNQNVFLIRAWMLDELPNFLNFYQEQFALLKKYQDAYNDASDRESKENIRIKMVRLLATIQNRLTAELTKVSAALQQLTAFNADLNNRIKQMFNSSAELNNEIESSRKEVWGNSERYPCDKDQIRHIADDIYGKVRNQFQGILDNMRANGLDDIVIDRSSSSILGNLLAVQNSYSGAIHSLERANESPNIVIQKLNISNTYRFYSDLVAFAKEQFR